MGFAELEQIFEAVTTGLGQAPIVIDAEIRDKLAETPPACIKDPLGLSCQLQACWQYGQSSAQRPECSKIQDAYIETQACPDGE